MLVLVRVAGGLFGVSGTLAIVLVVVGLAVVILGYPIICEVATRGRSPGKAAFGLRVVTVDGAPEAPRHAFIRSALGLVDFMIPRSEARRVGNECVSTCRSRWSPYP